MSKMKERSTVVENGEFEFACDESSNRWKEK